MSELDILRAFFQKLNEVAFLMHMRPEMKEEFLQLCIMNATEDLKRLSGTTYDLSKIGEGRG